MDLSVIIVSYNVRSFLEKCIVSVRKSLEGLDGEVIVIDNQSSDSSAEMVRSHFPDVKLIANAENRGFARACNQGLRMSSGTYALLLNPDTLVSEDTFRRCFEFMESHPEAAACGVRMVDGTGSFLPESMRGLPTPLSAFFKMTGINALFPHSMFFNGYYMGGRDPGQIQQIPVLTGAFMFIRMSALRKIGMLDEDYFMYGEDIDLCYRMVRAGYQNYYLPETSIIHYKGESTHRGSLRYIRHFYQAMMIYVSKHIHGAGGGVFKLMIILAVVLRGLLGGIKRVFKTGIPVLVDAAIIVWIVIFVKTLWARWYFQDADHFDTGFYKVNLPMYCVIWLLGLFLSGAHDTQRNFRRVFYGVTIGTLAILVIYAMLPLQYRSSRAVILISALMILFVMLVVDLGHRLLRKTLGAGRRIAIVGSDDEIRRIMELMNRVGAERTIVGWIAANGHVEGKGCLGDLSQLEELVLQHKIEELIFSAQDIGFHQINIWMTRLGPSLAYRISSGGSDQIVGSDSKKAQGTLYTADIELVLAHPSYRRAKRIVDILAALLFICLWPFIAGWRKNASAKFRNVITVLQGKKTWIGYQPGDALLSELPSLKPGVLSAGSRNAFLDVSEVHMINYIYAREYSVWKDIDLLLRNIHQLI